MPQPRTVLAAALPIVLAMSLLPSCRSSPEEVQDREAGAEAKAAEDANAAAPDGPGSPVDRPADPAAPTEPSPVANGSDAADPPPPADSGAAATEPPRSDEPQPATEDQYIHGNQQTGG
jgi:hypothetical protein